MNIPLSKIEIMDILQLESMPRNWKSNGLTISTYCGAYTFKSGFSLSMFTEGIKKLIELNPTADHDSLFLVMFAVLSKGIPNLFIKAEIL